MKSRLPRILGIAAGAATLLVVGPVALAMALLRSSPEAEGPTLAARIFIALFVLVLTLAAGFAAAGLTRLALRLFGRSGRG